MLYFDDDTLKGLLFHLLTAPCKALQTSDRCFKTVVVKYYCSWLHNISSNNGGHTSQPHTLQVSSNKLILNILLCFLF